MIVSFFGFRGYILIDFLSAVIGVVVDCGSGLRARPSKHRVAGGKGEPEAPFHEWSGETDGGCSEYAVFATKDENILQTVGWK